MPPPREKSPVSRPWRFTPLDPSRVRGLCDTLDLKPLTAQVLIARGLGDLADARAFLNPTPHDLHDPETLPGVPEAADRVVAAVKAKRRVTIYGDYDCDGVAATALLVKCLRLAHAEVDYFIPDRLTDGYGLNADTLADLHAGDPDRLIVSVDCGIASVAEAARAKELGLELIVTDHHTFADELPDAAVLVHPRLPGSAYPFGDLCGAGVAFKLAWAVSRRLGDGKKANVRLKNFLIEAMGLAALATVADVVPLRGENRVLVQSGLRSLFHRAPPGLRALLDACGLEEGRPISAEDVGFRVAPRINAAGRLKQAGLAVELLLSDDADRIGKLVAYLGELNETRQKVERGVVKEAKKQVAANGWEDAGALVLASGRWHPGVVGIAAGRVAEHYGRPAVLIALGQSGDPDGGTGSARSHGGFDLCAGLARCGEHLIGYGGHAAAAGVRLKTDRLSAFRDAFAADVAATHAPSDDDLAERVDAEVRLADCTLAAVKELDEKLGPFGRDNPRPVFVATGVALEGEPRRMGADDKHLSARFAQFGRTMRGRRLGPRRGRRHPRRRPPRPRLHHRNQPLAGAGERAIATALVAAGGVTESLLVSPKRERGKQRSGRRDGGREIKRPRWRLGLTATEQFIDAFAAARAPSPPTPLPMGRGGNERRPAARPGRPAFRSSHVFA